MAEFTSLIFKGKKPGTSPCKPCHPWVSGVVGVLMGPMAAGAVLYFNLSRLHNHRKGLFLLGLSVILTVIFWWVASRLDPENISGFKYLFQSLVGSVYALVQLKEFGEWKTRSGPQAKAARFWTALPAALLGMMASMVVVLGLVSLSVAL